MSMLNKRDSTAGERISEMNSGKLLNATRRDKNLYHKEERLKELENY